MAKPLRSRRKLLLFIAAPILAAALFCALYILDYYPADETAEAAMLSDAAVTVQEEKDCTVFLPAQETDIGLIFYGGGKVDHPAYAPLLRSLAEEGVLCVLAKMPARLAVLDSDAAADLTPRFPHIDTWFIGGHSLGGSMAAAHAAEEGTYAGVILLAAYSTADLTEQRVLSLYGTEDGVLNMEKYGTYRANLPESAEEHILDGGCHACFGSYGAQEGDGEHTLSPAQQRALSAAYILSFVGSE